MNKPRLFAALLLLIFAGTGCSLAPVRPVPEPAEILAPTEASSDWAESEEIQAPEPAEIVIPDGTGTESDQPEPEPIKAKLYRQYQQWKGTTYRYKGLSKKGVDCSGFVYVTYLEHFGIELPRSTQHQSQVGTEVERSGLRAGDLVFFKTGVNRRHVGIYLEDGRFLHASTKRGVIISSLDDFYWRDRYWLARRVGL